MQGQFAQRKDRTLNPIKPQALNPTLNILCILCSQRLRTATAVFDFGVADFRIPVGFGSYEIELRVYGSSYSSDSSKIGL